MPQPLENRIQAAMGHAARAQTVAELLPEIDAAIAEAEAEHKRLDKLSTSIDATEAEADGAADDAQRAARRITRLKAQRDQVQTRHNELMNSERRKRRLVEYQQIRSRRDQLADELRERLPAIVAELTQLFRKMEASDAEIGEFQKAGLPTGCEWLGSAEAIARGLPGHFSDGAGGQIHRFTKMKIPALDGRGFAWPDQRKDFHVGFAAMLEAERTAQAQARRETEARAASVRNYRVELVPNRTAQPYIQSCGAVIQMKRAGAVAFYPEEVEAARRAGHTVEEIRAGASIGSPASGAFLT